MVHRGPRPWAQFPILKEPYNLLYHCSTRLCCKYRVSPKPVKNRHCNFLPLGGGADGNAFPVQILTQPVVQLRQAPKLEVCHGLLRLLDLGRVADITGGILRHRNGT